MKIGWFGGKTRNVEATLGETSVRSRDLSNLVASHGEPQMTAPGGKKAPDAVAVVKAAQQRPILFRQLFPPPPEPGMSFYGGAPIGPAGMPWPRSDVDGLPLPFIMQWETAALAAHDSTGLMPESGAIYLFSTLAWRDHFEFRFLYVPADGHRWATLPVSDDLPPALGDGAWQSPLASRDIPIEQQSGLRLLPCWPFQPLAIDYPHPVDDADEETQYWHESIDVKELLLRAQDPSAAPQPATRAKTRFERPFPAFPHDWAAVRVIASAALGALARRSSSFWMQFQPEPDAAMKETLTAQWRTAAVSLLEEAAGNAANAAIPSHLADMLWQRMGALEPCISLRFERSVRDAVNISLGLGSEAVAAIPDDWVQSLAEAHSLATLRYRDEYEQEFHRRLKEDRTVSSDQHVHAAEYKQAKDNGALQTIRDIWAPTPNRMFGLPSYVQGAAEEFVSDWLVLLELSGADSIGMPMGEGVFQFMIRPQDLADLRFDRVKAITGGY